MSRFTRLERAVMDALAHDLHSQVPDLAGQFEESRPSQRRNTGIGMFTEMIVDRSRPAPAFGPTGELGTAHAMVGDLPDPIAFKARFRNGVLLGLFGDSYGQNTRAIDFATTPFDQVFTVNDQGDSIAFEPAAQMPPSPLLDLHLHADNEPAARWATPAPARDSAPRNADTRIHKDVIRARQGAIAVEPFLAAAQAADRPAPPMSQDDKVSLIVGLWVLIVAVGVIAVIFGASPFFVAILGGVVGRAAQSPKGLATIQRVMEAYKAARAISG